MTDNNPQIQELVNQFACQGIIDKLNDPNKQQLLNNLSVDDQNELAQKIVINWIEKGLEVKELLSIKRDIPASKHDSELTGFNRCILQAVNLFANFNGLFDAKNPHPEYMIQELTPETFDDLNDMPALKECLIKKMILPNMDFLVAKIKDPKQRNELSKAFRSESLINEYVNSANVVKGWVELLKGDSPWRLFEERGFNADVVLEHASLVSTMITEAEAIDIGQKLQGTPKEKREMVTQGLHLLDEAFKGINRINHCDNIFTIMSGAFAIVRPTQQEILATVSKIMGNSFFKSVQPELCDSASSSSELKL
jgi:hypothetical protein